MIEILLLGFLLGFLSCFYYPKLSLSKKEKTKKSYNTYLSERNNDEMEGAIKSYSTSVLPIYSAEKQKNRSKPKKTSVINEEEDLSKSLKSVITTLTENPNSETLHKILNDPKLSTTLEQLTKDLDLQKLAKNFDFNKIASLFTEAK